MARSPRLKVFRTPIGFHDAYVAAPSRAAALRAWGAERDLFARGAAEEVTDPALTAEPLAAPGTVVRRSRGTAAEQLAAAPARARSPRRAPSPPPSHARTPERPPEPDRADLDAAEQALAAAAAKAARVGRDFDEREAVLARERRAAERGVADDRRRAERARDRAATAYDAAMEEWREA
jgi:hypothetical protein